MINTIRNTFLNFLSNVDHSYFRYMHKNFDMDDKLIGVIGQRGVGKTTFILQYLKNLNIPFEKKLYFSADHFVVLKYSLYEIAKEFYKKGGEVLAIDEIHKYPNFELELKSIYDTFDLKVIFSGSSAIKLYNSRVDLSRRAVLYNVFGLSLKEFIEFETDINLNSYSLDEILSNHTEIAYEINQKIKPFEFFEKYLKYGYYPFYKQNINLYHQKLNEVLNIVIESDLPVVFKIDSQNIIKLKKLLSLLCISKPYELNISKLSAKIGINRATLYHYLSYLEAGSLIKTVDAKTRGDTIFNKPKKLYLNNTNLIYANCSDFEIGTIREAFFANQLSQNYDVKYSKIGDFLVDNKYTIEVGGAKKSYKQIADIKNSFLVADDIEVGFKNKIPLWLFGFLY